MAELEAQHISKTYQSGQNQLTVLQDVSLSINKGEFLAIAGQSGSGKSTLMNILGCLDVPTQGNYFIEGQDTLLMAADELARIRNKKIGFVFQQFNLLANLNALDNVALPQLYADISDEQARERATEMLTLVGLADRMHHYPNQLSGGQQQRVSIARALVNSPSIILADEPTGNLDSKSGMDMMDIFINLNKTQRITIIIVTHDMNLAQKTDRIIKILDGKIVEDAKR